MKNNNNIDNKIIDNNNTLYNNEEIKTDKKQNKNSDAKLKANKKYLAKTYKTRTLNIKINDYNIIMEYINNNNLTFNGFVMDIIKKELKRNGIDI